MEFDTNVRLVQRDKVDVVSVEDLDGVCADLWKIFADLSREVAHAGGGSFWLDYSNMLCTRYMVCNVRDISADAASPDSTMSEPDIREYSVEILSARKFGYFADVAFGLLAVGFMWCLSKIVVPEPASLHVALTVVIAGIAGLLLAYVSRPFGSSEADKLKEGIVRHFKKNSIQ